MPRFACWIVPMMALAFVVGLSGCHVTAPQKGAADPGPGHGRFDRSFAVPMRPTLAATLATLDDLGIRPERMTIQSGSETPGGQPALLIEPEATNAAMLPDGARADDIFVRHELTMPGSPTTPFYPIFAAYKGTAADGRAVLVSIATKRGDEADNLVTVRIGHRGDEAWSRAFLARVATRVDGTPGAGPAPPGSPAPQ